MYYGNNYNQQLVRVNGECGARAYMMMPNSACLLLDEKEPIVWLAQTDVNGYKNVTGYRINKIEPTPPVDMAAIIKRLDDVEARLNESNSATGTEQ